MKRWGFVLTSLILILMSLPVLAQQPGAGNAGAPPGFGPGPWHYGWHGPHHAIFLAPFVLLLALIGFVTIIMLLVRLFSRGGHRHWHGLGGPAYRGQWGGRSAIDILEERFARGEIDKNEFEEKRKLLGR